jgi:hypothetical protein
MRPPLTHAERRATATTRITSDVIESMCGRRKAVALIPRIRPPMIDPTTRKMSFCFVAALVLSPVIMTVVTAVEMPGHAIAQ